MQTSNTGTVSKRGKAQADFNLTVRNLITSQDNLKMRGKYTRVHRGLGRNAVALVGLGTTPVLTAPVVHFGGLAGESPHLTIYSNSI
jgi:hypothetical protein